MNLLQPEIRYDEGLACARITPGMSIMAEAANRLKSPD
jgi:hypothetical protein